MAGSSHAIHNSDDYNYPLLQHYLLSVRHRSIAIPLFGLYDQANLEDQVSIDLSELYTPLTVREEVLRETIIDPRAFSLDEIIKTNQDPKSSLGDFRTRIRLISDNLYQAAIGEMNEVLAERYRSLGSSADFHLEATDDPSALAQLRALARHAHRIEVYGPELVTEALAHDQRMVLLGEPGSGKSTALRYIAYGLAEQTLRSATCLPHTLRGWEDLQSAIPIYAPILPLAWRSNEQSIPGSSSYLWDYIIERIGRELTDFKIPHGIHQEVIEAVLHTLTTGNAVLLLDGLDEVAGAVSRRMIIETVKAFAEKYPQCRMIVACRVRAYQNNVDLQLADWKATTISDWNTSQTRLFVNTWYRKVHHDKLITEESRTKRTEQLLTAISIREDLAKLGNRPLLLTIMALVHLYDGQLPENRVRLYGRCIHILIDRWEIIGRQDPSQYGRMMEYIGIAHLDAHNLRTLLEDIALKAHGAASSETLARIPRNTLEHMVSDALRELGMKDPDTGTKRFLEYTDYRAGLLHASDSGDAYVFAHTTFQEYLAGLALVRDVEFVQQIMQIRHDDRWRVPILLGIGHCVSEGIHMPPHQLMEALICEDARQKKERHRDIIFAAEIAEDVKWERLLRGGSSFSRFRARLSRELAQVLKEPVLPMRERLRAAFLLAQVGDSRPGVCDFPPAMTFLPGGEFRIGLPPAQARIRDQRNTQTIIMAPFECGTYPITNAQYQQFIADNGYDPTKPWWDDIGRKWLTRYDDQTPDLDPIRHRQFRKDATHKDLPFLWENAHYGVANPNRPVVGVCWYEAAAFCRWLTQRLNDDYEYMMPSELEWEYAARGLEGRLYPWGWGQMFGGIDARSDRPNRTVPVGCCIECATPELIMDMLYNVREWTRSAYRPYPYDPNDGREEDVPDHNRQVVIRGASLPEQWRDPQAMDRTAAWKDSLPSTEIGFRVIRKRQA